MPCKARHPPGIGRVGETSSTPKLAKEQNLSQKGAMALAKRLERFWHDKGFRAARFWAEPIGERFEKVETYEIYRVVSNLANGLPPRYLDHSDGK